MADDASRVGDRHVCGPLPKGRFRLLAADLGQASLQNSIASFDATHIFFGMQFYRRFEIKRSIFLPVSILAFLAVCID